MPSTALIFNVPQLLWLFTFSNISRYTPLLLRVLLGTGYLFRLSCRPQDHLRQQVVVCRTISFPMPSTALVFNVPQLLWLFTFSNVSRYAPLLLRVLLGTGYLFWLSCRPQDHLRRQVIVHQTISSLCWYRTHLQRSATFAALYLFQHLEVRFPATKGSSGHRLFILAFMLTSKIICDDTYSNN